MYKIITDYFKFIESTKIVDPYSMMVFGDESDAFILNEEATMEETPKSKQAAEIMKECRQYVFRFLPFFASLLIKLPFIEIRDPRYTTMCTNGLAIWYNADFVLDNTTQYGKGTIVWVICHEIMHCALGHVGRLLGRDHKKWNIATDHAINLLIGPDLVTGKDSLGDGISMPGGYEKPKYCYDKKYVNMSSEQIYKLLEEESKNGGGGNGEGEGSGEGQETIGDVTSEPLKIPKEVWDQLPKDIQDEIRGKVAVSSASVIQRAPIEGEGDLDEAPNGGEGEDGQSASPSNVPGEEDGYAPKQNDINSRDKNNVETASRNIGKASANISRGFTREMDKKVDWKKVLRKFITQLTDKEQYILPNKRHIHAGRYLYATKKDYSLDTAIVVFDTSGSVDATMLGQMAAELKNIREETHCANLYVLYCDAAIKHVDLFKKTDKIHIKAAGGGGTSFVPPFEWIKKNIIAKKKKVEVVVYLTDGHGDFPYKPTYHQKVIWVIIDSEVTPPFGKILRIDTK